MYGAENTKYNCFLSPEITLLPKYTLSNKQGLKLLLLSPEASTDAGPSPAAELEGPWDFPRPSSLCRGRWARRDVLRELCVTAGSQGPCRCLGIQGVHSHMVMLCLGHQTSWEPAPAQLKVPWELPSLLSVACFLQRTATRTPPHTHTH